MILLLMVAAGMSAQEVQKDEKPPALAAMVQSRFSMYASDVRWSWTRGPGAREMFYRSRVAANGDAAHERLGDGDAVLSFTEAGKPNTVTSHGYLRKKQDGQVWNYFKGMLTANVTPTDGMQASQFSVTVPDVRTIGLANSFYINDWLGENDVLHIDDHAHTFKERVIDGIHIVSAVADDNSRITWHINPDKGWNAERIVTHNPQGRVIAETDISLKLYGDTWFPETVVQRSGGMVSQIRIQEASFNEGAALAKLGPTDIGVEPGVQIIGAGGMPERSIWDGNKLVPAKKWFDAVRKGEKAYGPNVAYTLANGSSHLVPGAPKQLASGLPVNLRRVDAWEKYVEDFILKHSLRQDQTQKARQILKQCQSNRDRYLARNTNKLKKLREQGSKKQRERMAKLLEPVKEIFEKQLKPRLSKLLTRAQRAKCDCHE